MFSIIIPTKNEEKVIERTLNQFKSLKLPHEVIVYDGISTDNTVKLARKYTKKVFAQKEHKITIAKARNEGAKYAKGDRFRKAGYLKMFYIYFLNGMYMKLYHRSYSKEWIPIR